jgi:hypothetical protein
MKKKPAKEAAKKPAPAKEAVKKPAKTPKRKIAPPTEVARLTRLDEFDVVIAKPLQVCVLLRPPYAAELLRQLRFAQRPLRGHHQISVDCPVEIIMDATMLKLLIGALEAEVG